VAPNLIKVNHGKMEARGAAIDTPLATVTATQRGDALVLPTLIQTGYGEREGQAARVPGLHKPLGTMVNGQKHALVAAFLARHFGGVVGAELPQPLHTVTARDHHSLASATLAQAGAPVDHVSEVRAFLTAYYGDDGGAGKGQSLRAPMRTLTAKARLGLVTVAGEDYQIVDIGMRMLEPHELLRAQFGSFAAAYDLSAATTKSGQVRLIGNSVCPEVAAALVACNAPAREERAA
jgi:DNA (cytosine-5)-methyltransferase 1